jgi:tetratricopeptide (TPR) repeat protein
VVKVRLPDMEVVGDLGIVLEPHRSSLAKHMKEVYLNYSQAKEKANKALNFIKEHYTWDKIGEILKEKITLLKDKPLVRYNTIENLLIAGRDFAKTGNYEKAIELFNKVLELKSDCHEACSNLAAVYWRNNQKQKALDNINKAMKLNPYHKDTVWNYGLIMMENGKIKEAVKVYKSYLEKYPEDMEIRNTLNEIEAEVKPLQGKKKKKKR